MTDALAELTARARIHDAIVRNARGVDRLDRALILSTFHPDAIDDHGAFKGSPEAFADWVIARNAGVVHSSNHVLANQTIVLDGETARVETYFTSYQLFDRDGGQHRSISCGRYLDRFEARDGDWRIADRLTVVDWRWSEAVAEAAPAAVAGLAVGVRDPSDPSYAFFTGA